MFTLKAGFESLNRSRIPYCVISDYIGLPSIIPEQPLDILTTDPGEVVALMGLVRKGYPEQYSMPGATGLVINVYKKSAGVFPDVFEAALVNKNSLYNDCVRIPSVSNHGIMVLYRQLFHYGAYKGKENQWIRRPLEELAKQHTGNPRRTKYKSLDFTP